MDKNKISIAMGYENNQIGKNILTNYFNILNLYKQMYRKFRFGLIGNNNQNEG